jgi:hypothetical protein
MKALCRSAKALAYRATGGPVVGPQLAVEYLPALHTNANIDRTTRGWYSANRVGELMDLLVVLSAGGFIALAIGFGVVFARLVSRDRMFAFSDEWEDVISPTRYRTMERLLEEADQKVAEAQGDPTMEKELRRVRVKIFRGFMQQISEDFNRIGKAIKLMMVTSQVDRPDLSGFLMKQQLVFAFAMMSMEVKVTLYGFGCTGNDVQGLTRSFDRARAQLQTLAAIAKPSVA